MAELKQKISRTSATSYSRYYSILCPAVSVIIPLYNAEKFIGDCLNSILAQTFQNFEVVVVDDCSTDNGVTVVQSYAEKFGGRLILSHMEKNSGSGGLPRNKGLILSRGEYVFFVDADDMLTKTALEEMYTLAKNYDADVVYCEKYYTSEANATNVTLSYWPTEKFVDKPTFETENLKERVQGIIRRRYCVMTCVKFIRRNLLTENEIFFSNVKPGEDDIWTYGLVFYAKKFLRVPNATYIYRQSDNSIIRKERTPQQTINFWLNLLFLGLQDLDKLMSRHEFFKANPQQRHAVLDHFIYVMFSCIFQSAATLSPFEVYETIRQEFGDKFGEWNALIPALCAALNKQQKINVMNVRKFNEFTAQAQARIAQLEAELKNKN